MTHKPGSGPSPHLKRLLSKGVSMDDKLQKHPGNHDQKVHAGKVRAVGAQIRADGERAGGTVQAAATERVRRIKALLDAIENGDQAAGNRAWNALPAADRARLDELNGHFQKDVNMKNLRAQTILALEKANVLKHYGPGPHPSGTDQSTHGTGGEGPSPNDLKARGASGKNPQAYDVDYDSGEPSLKGAKAFIQDLQTNLDSIFQAASITTGRGDSETPADMDYATRSTLGSALRAKILDFGIDPESLNDFDEFVNQVFPWERGLNVSWPGSTRSQEHSWEPDGSGELLLDLRTIDDHDAEIKANIAEYLQVGLDENQGPTFDKPTGRFGVDVTHDGEPGGRASHATFDRLQGKHNWTTTYFFNKPGTSLYQEGKVVPISGHKTYDRPLTFRTVTGKVWHIYPDQLYTKQDETKKGLRGAVADQLGALKRA